MAMQSGVFYPTPPPASTPPAVETAAASTPPAASFDAAPVESFKRLGSHDEITVRYRDFALFWRENPVSARFALQTEARSLLPTERVKKCLRHRISKEQLVQVLKAAALNAAHYGNLQVCGSVWACPVCSAKIATRKREELTAGVDTWTGQGNTVLLPTFTLQHLAADSCADVLTAITEAHKQFWAGRRGVALRDDYRIVGKVRGLEVTYTPNGWHWHYHVLLFIRGSLAANLVDDMRREMAAHWQHVVSKAGRFADGQHGLDLRITDRDVVDYVSKYGKEGEGNWRKQAESWTEAHELALATIKRATSGGLTPFQLLAMSLAGDKDAGQLFAEYHATVKGKSQLHWSKGLRALLGLGAEKSDEEIAQEQDQMAVIMALLDSQHWRVILGNAARGDLLQAAATGNPWRVLEFLEDLGLQDVLLPGLVDDPNYFGPHRRWGDEEENL